MTPQPPTAPPGSVRWAAALGAGLLLTLAVVAWWVTRPKVVDTSGAIEDFVGRWTPDWDRMRAETGTLGSPRRGEALAADTARTIDTWQRRGIQLLVDRRGEVHVVADAEPGSPPVSKHAATVEGDQLRLRGFEANGKPLPPGWTSVLRLRKRDGVLLWIPLFGGSGELTVLLRRP